MYQGYSINSRLRETPSKPQIQLGQSLALQKFEKLQAKYSSSLDGTKFKSSFNKNSSNNNNNQDDDEDDDDPIFKKTKMNANKFIKQKPEMKKSIESDDDSISDSKTSDLEISLAGDGRGSPQKRSSINARPASRLLSNSSLSSIKSPQKRSQSKVKFVKTDKRDDDANYYDEQEQQDNEESTIIEDLFNKNLILDIDQLETARSNLESNKKKTNRKLSKSPTITSSRKRSESVISIIEDNELVDVVSSRAASRASQSSRGSPSILEANLILDIKDLEKSFAKPATVETKTVSKPTTTKDNHHETKKHKKDKKSESERSSSRNKKREKEKEKEKEKKKEKTKSMDKNKKSKNKESQTQTVTNLDTTKSETSILTETISDNQIETEDDDEIETIRSDDNSTRQDKRKSHRSVGNVKNSRDNNDDYDMITPRRSYNDSGAGSSNKQKPEALFKPTTSKQIKTSSVEIQVDPIDLLKNSDLLKTVSVYNPSSILLATNYLNDSKSLNELNQLTGYTMINQAFNDLIRINVNFVKNFLTMQRNLYEQQIKSVHPK